MSFEQKMSNVVADPPAAANTQLKTIRFPGRQPGRSPESKAAFEQRVLELARSAQGSVCIDFADVDFVGSSDLSELVALHRRVREHGRTLVLCNLHPLVQEVFQITRLTKLFEIRV